MMIIGISIWALALGLTVVGSWLCRKRFRETPPHLDAPFGLFPVSIIKPLKGVDDQLEKNLEGFFKLDYPDFELLFCVAHESDPAYQLISRMIARFPRVNSRLMSGEEVVGPNPKVNNMIGAYESARHDWVLISDSNVSVRPDYLKRLVAHLRPGVGMVTAVVAGHDASGIGGNLEATYLNTFYARGMTLAASFGRVCVVGKSMLFQRSTAKRFGGLRTLGQYLAEDYMAGEAMQRLGLEVVIAVDPISQVIGRHSFHAFWKRHLRWGRIRKKHGTSAFVLEPLTGAVVSGAIGALSLHAAFDVPMPLFLIFHLGIWSFCDVLVMREMKIPLKWSMPIYWFLREALALPLWIHVASGNTVNWRGHKLSLLTGGILDTRV